MKLRLSILLILLLAGIASAQSSPKMIYYNTTPGCDRENSKIAAGDYLACDSILLDGSRVALLNYNGIGLAVTFAEGDYFVAEVFVSNKTGNRINVFASQAGVVYHESADSFNSGKKMIASYKSLSPKEISEKAVSGTRWKNIMNALAASTSKNQAQITTTDNQGRTLNSTVTMPNTDAQNRARDENNARINSANEKAEQMNAVALLDNTLLDQSTKSGMLYFKREKKSKFKILYIKIDDTVFGYVING